MKQNIAQRPPEVVARSRIGDWEGDIVGGEKKERPLTHLERKSGYLLAAKTPDGTAPEIRRAAETAGGSRQPHQPPPEKTPGVQDPVQVFHGIAVRRLI